MAKPRRIGKKDQPGAKSYRVSGVQSIWLEDEELKPGDEFTALLTPEYETQMLMGGQLELMGEASAAENRELADTAVDE